MKISFVPAFVAILLSCVSSAHAGKAHVFPKPLVSEPLFVIPEKGHPSDVQLPPSLQIQHSNNNVAIEMHGGRLFMAWRSAPTHFASKKTKIQVMSSGNLGRSWEMEATIAEGTDLREPHLQSFEGRLYLYYAVLGGDPLAFTPQGMKRTEYLGPSRWTSPIPVGNPGEMFWEMKARNGFLWLTGYHGGHYGAGATSLSVFFRKSKDGLHWDPVGGPDTSDVVYQGGVSEAAFDFDPHGNLWAVTRNEDGDPSGWGSHVARAFPDSLGSWIFPEKSSPRRYDSPRMFPHGEELYLVARRDIGGPFDLRIRWLPFVIQKWLYLLEYSLRPKRTSLYGIDRDAGRVRTIGDLPGVGDTAFPSIVTLPDGRVLVANYTAPLDDPDQSWIEGQLSKRGTQIYLVMLEFPR